MDRQIYKCRRKHGITDEEFDAVRTTADKNTVEASEDLKCFAKCLVDASAVMQTGRLDIDRLVKLSARQGFDKDKVRERAVLCAPQIPNEIGCDSAWALYTCIFTF